MSIDSFPNIKAVALVVALDNDLINRERTEEKFFEDCNGWVASYDNADLVALEEWIGGLSEEDRETLACGEHSDMKKVEESCPRNSDGLALSTMFDDFL